MKVSIFTTITNPELNQYAWREAINNYLDFADEVIVVDGASTDGTLEELVEMHTQVNLNAGYEKLQVGVMPWPQDKWDWSELPKHINFGLDRCTGDVAIKMDIDYLIHEKDFDLAYRQLETMVNNKFMLGWFVKLTVLNKKKGYRKTEMPLAVNKFFKDIKFGKNNTVKTDWCYPIYSKGIDKNGVYYGSPIQQKMVFGTGIDIYNYDYFFRTKEKAKEIFWRFAKAYATQFDSSWGSTEEDAWNVFLKQEKSRLKKNLVNISHPEAIKQRVLHMREDQFGYNNWDNFNNL